MTFEHLIKEYEKMFGEPSPVNEFGMSPTAKQARKMLESSLETSKPITDDDFPTEKIDIVR